jgi:hypothetical protein
MSAVSRIFRRLYFAVLQCPCCKALKNNISLWRKNRDANEMPIGNHLDPVDSSLYVFRLARPSKDFEEKKSILPISLEAFELSTDDKKGTPPHLSVWVEEYTIPSEAYAFLGLGSPKKIICWLNVNDIRRISSDVEGQVYNNLLDVLWVNIENSQAGAKGHAGIIGMDDESLPKGLTNRQEKNLRKDLRFKLAEIANKNTKDNSRPHIVEL